MTEIILHRSCCLSSQRYNFLKANHNHRLIFLILQVVVYQVKDTIFWKQITTCLSPFWVRQWLFIKSKIQFFESKSQLTRTKCYIANSCLSSQRYNFLKANHNIIPRSTFPIMVVYQVKDTIFWKQITTQFLSVAIACSCLSSQRYNFLKANHNTRKRSIKWFKVVYQVKDTIFWKQITTIKAWWNFPPLLFIKSKIQFFESKSQHIYIVSMISFCCLSSQRYNFLKANHNSIFQW